MKKRRAGWIAPAGLMILLLGVLAAAYTVKGGARAGREYIEETGKSAEKDSGRASAAEPGENRGQTPVAGQESGEGQELDGPGQATLPADKESRDRPEAGPGETVEESEKAGEEEETDAGSSDIVMLFAGDVYFSDHVLNAYDGAGGIQGVLDEGIRAEIDGAHIFMVNQEFPFTVRGTAAADKQFTFRVPESRIHILQEMGVDIVTLANNHILDFGEEGLLDSLKALDEAGIPHVGGGKDFAEASALKTVIIGQKTIGFLGMSRVYMSADWAAGNAHPGVFSTYDTTLPLKAIEEAKKQCDYLVVYVHWGVEREETPKDYQKAMGRAYIDAGADLVVGSHPHVLQPLEEYKGKTIAYSLGNFVFGSSIPRTALLKVVWGGEGTQVSLIPCTSSKGFTRLSE